LKKKFIFVVLHWRTYSAAYVFGASLHSPHSAGTSLVAKVFFVHRRLRRPQFAHVVGENVKGARRAYIRVTGAALTRPIQIGYRVAALLPVGAVQYVHRLVLHKDLVIYIYGLYFYGAA